LFKAFLTVKCGHTYDYIIVDNNHVTSYYKAIQFIGAGVHMATKFINYHLEITLSSGDYNGSTAILAITVPPIAGIASG
jgi:hypothetical protein